MTLRNIIYLTLVILLLCNCSNSKLKEKNTILKHKEIDLNENIIGYGGFLVSYENVIIGTELSQSLPPFYCLVQNEGKHTFYRFGNRGQGPNDFIHPFSIQNIQSGYVGVMDMSSRAYSEFYFPKENEEINIEKKINFGHQLFRIIKTAYNNYIGLSMQEGLFVMTDSIGESIRSFFEYPYSSKSERQLNNRYRSFAYQGNLSTNTSKTKCVYSSFSGEIIHFYNIEKDDIIPIVKIEKEYPIYQNDSDENNTGIIVGEQSVLGYVSTYATDEFVYALFNGKRRIDLLSQNYEASTLRIFDWNGTLVKEYDLDVPCGFMCVSNDNSKIWAIATEPNNSLVCFDLNDNNSENSQNNEYENKKAITDIVKVSYNTDKEKNIIITNFGEKVFEEKAPSNLTKHDLGKIRLGEEKKITMQFISVLKMTSSSENLIVKEEAIDSSGQHIVSFHLTKHKAGIFNDTAYISIDESFTLPVVFSGEVLE